MDEQVTAMGEEKMMPRAVLLLLNLNVALVMGCAFHPDLEEQGYLPCESANDCSAFCRCMSHWCLPEDDSMDPRKCGNDNPLGLLNLDWPTQGTTIMVNTVTDSDSVVSPDEVSLRNAILLANEIALGDAPVPVQIVFDPTIFKPATDAIHTIGLGSALPPLIGSQVLLRTDPNIQIVLQPASAVVGTIEVGLTVACSSCVVAGLKLENFPNIGLGVMGAQDVVLLGVSVSNCGAAGKGVGVLVDGSSKRVTLGVLEPKYKELIFSDNSDAGIVIDGAASVVVFGASISQKRNEKNTSGIIVKNQARRVVIGLPTGLDTLQDARNLIEQSAGAGIRIHQVSDRVVVRGTVFRGCDLALSLVEEIGSVMFVHNTVLNPTGSVFGCFLSPDTGGLGVTGEVLAKNDVFSSAAPKPFWMAGGGNCGSLQMTGDRLVLYQTLCNVANLGLCSWSTADTVLPSDPQLDGAGVPLPGSPAIDQGDELFIDGVGLDVNGKNPGFFNGAGPDLGAIESP